MAKNGELTSRQYKAIAALISAGSVKQACEISKVGRTTMDRWLGKPEFTSALADQKTMMIDETSRVLLAGQQEALNVLRELMINGKSEATRRAAANDWLNHSQDFNGLAQFEYRLTALELTVARKVVK